MNTGNPKDQTTPARKQIPGLVASENTRQQIEIAQQEITALESILEHIDTPEYKWLVEQFLPAESMRIATEAFIKINPEDDNAQIKYAIAEGQLEQNKNLTGKLRDVKGQIVFMKNQLNELNKNLGTLIKKQEKANDRRSQRAR